MVKVSISLPNNTQITFESEESEVLREVVSLALRDLPRDLMQAPASVSPGAPTEKSTSLAASELSTATSIPPVPRAEPIPAPETTIARETAQPSIGASNGEGAATVPPEFLSESGETNFTAFCRDAKPLGDMRRVVVAAEGASRHFGVEGITADDLAWLFDLAEWRRPGNFTQTLRNSARSKFGWLERIPGRSGRYATTALGRSKTLPNS